MRESSLHFGNEARVSAWLTVNQMRVPASFHAECSYKDLAIADLSCLPKVGLKGPGAAGWLSTKGVTIPQEANCWLCSMEGAIVARLGQSEFLIEDSLFGTTASRLDALLNDCPNDVYPVPRHDTCIALTGERIYEVLVQICSINFRAMEPRSLVLTSMVGVSVLVVADIRFGVPAVRIWCDPTFGPYLWETLRQILGEVNGSPIGLRQLFPQLNDRKEHS
jgi:sarcosine oxidase, subunit gamma